MPALADVAAAVFAKPTPLLLLDTCSILDVMRVPVRRQSNQLTAIGRLIAACTAVPEKCRMIRASIVAKEFANNRPAVEAELRRFIADLKSQADEFDEASRHFGLPVAANFYSSLPLAASLIGLADSLLNVCLEVDADQSANNRAVDRTLHKKRPARHGRGLQDSIIVEECLELVRLLRAGGFAEIAVFLSSNSDDFCEDDKKTLHADLAADFTAVDLQYARIWPEAANRLGV
jgi:hypothetical protein